MTPQEVRAFFEAHWTVRQYQNFQMPLEHLETLLFAAHRAPTDATAQMYSLIRLENPELRQSIATLSSNPHFASSSEAFIVCADVYRLKSLLERQGYTFGHWPAAAVHFAIGDAVMAAQNLLLAAEMLGYRGCWIGGVLSALSPISDLLELPEGVFPFAGLTIGLPAEEPKFRPRVQPELLFHTDKYHQPSAEELDAALERMAPITARGDWAQSLARYFATGGSMETREGLLRDFLGEQGFSHVQNLDELFTRAEELGYPEVVLRRKGAIIEAWIDEGRIAHRGEGKGATKALEGALEAAEIAARASE